MLILGSKEQRHVADVCIPPVSPWERRLLAMVKFMESVYKIKWY